MDPETMINLGVLAAFLGTGGATGFGAWKAHNADKQTKHTGNGGWAEDVTTQLGRIEDKVDSTDDKLDRHLEAHADAELAGRRRWRRP